MTTELLKQAVFECAVELLHHSEDLTDEQIANKLLGAIREHDKNEQLTPQERVVAIQVMNKLVEAIKEDESILQKTQIAQEG